MNKNKKILIISIVLVAIVFCGYFYYVYENKKQKVVFFDVGQGDSVFIKLADDQEILIDGGPDNSVLYKLGKYMPFYDRTLELVVLSHSHDDHLFGLIEVLKRYRVEKILMTCEVADLVKSTAYQNFWQLAKSKKVVIICVEDISRINVGQVNLEVIYPTKVCPLCVAEPGGNNSSVVLRLDFDGQKILLTGDVEQGAEKEILAGEREEELRADILKVPHHGSDTSLTEEFLEAVNPSRAIISVGADNSFGHPSLRTIRRLERSGVKILRTDEEGSIEIK